MAAAAGGLDEAIKEYLLYRGFTQSLRYFEQDSVIGPRIYKLLCSLVAPAKPGEKAFAELVAALTQHFAPKPSEIVQR